MEVITKVFSHNRPDTFNIYPLGDIHAGAAHCAEHDIQRMVEQIKQDKMGYWIGMGDYADAILKDDKRFDIEGLAPWVKKDNIVESQREWLKKLFEPIKDKCITLLTGNHEECFDDQTEILAENGWKHFKDLSEGERVYTYNLDRRTWQYEPVMRVVSYDHDGEMYKYNYGNISLVVTPEHDLVYRIGTGIPQKEHIKNLSGKCLKIPVAGYSHQPDYPISIGEITLSAWYITDGYCGAYNSAHFSQRKSNASHIKASLRNMGWKFTTYQRQRNITHICGKQLKKTPEPEVVISISGEYGKRLKKLVPDKHHLPEWVKHLSRPQFSYFIKAYLKGDGTPKQWCAYGTKEILEELQIACVTHGYKATLSEYREGDWRINIRFTRHQGTHWLNIKDFQPQSILYKGKVYCAETPSGTLFIRRDYKCCLTGNTIHLHYQDDLTRNLCKDLGVPYGGYSCFVVLSFKRSTSEGSKTFTIHAWHGSGAAQTEGARVMRLMRLVNDVQADIYLMGHLHCIAQYTPDRLICRSGRVKSIKLAAVTTGAWVKTYTQPKNGEQLNASYAEMRGYKPSRLGCPVIHIHPDSGEFNIES